MSTDFGQFRKLLDDVMNGSEEAARQLTETYSPHIIRAVRASLPQSIRSKMDSEDCAQSVWASLLLEPTGLAKFETPQQFIVYLASTAKHKIIDKYRHYCTQKNEIHKEVRIAALDRKSFERLTPRTVSDAPLKSDDPTPSALVSTEENWQAVLQRSSVRDQKIIAMRMLGLDDQQIADRLVVNERTVRRAVHRLATEFQK